MNKLTVIFLLSILFAVALIFETTVFSVPLVYVLGAFLVIFYRRVRIYIFVFLLAFFIDSLRVSNFGLTPVFLIALCVLIFIFERYSGSNDRLVASTIICASSIMYAHYLSYSVGFTIFLILIGVLISYIFYLFNKRGSALL